VLKWLHNTGCPWNSDTMCKSAAMAGHLDVLKWLHNTGCPWDKWTCAWPPRAGTWRC